MYIHVIVMLKISSIVCFFKKNKCGKFKVKEKASLRKTKPVTAPISGTEWPITLASHTSIKARGWCHEIPPAMWRQGVQIREMADMFNRKKNTLTTQAH